MKVKPLILTVHPPSPQFLSEYLKELKESVAEDKLRELEELNERTFAETRWNS